MRRLSRLLFGNSMEKQETQSSLSEFINQIYLGEQLSPEESRKNFQNGLVEIVDCGQHHGNGILVTENGYFLTAKHCVDHNIPFFETKIRLHNGRSYAIEKVCEFGQDDIALAKANISGECKPIKYRFYNTNLLEEKMPIALMTRKDGKQVTKYGYIERTSDFGVADYWHNGKLMIYNDHFLMLVIGGAPGDSGGIVITPDARLLGITSTGREKYHSLSAVKLLKALELIHSYKTKMV